MYSTLQRLNHYGSISTTFIMALLGLISLASFFTLPTLEPGSVTVNDLVVRRGRLQRWGATAEDIASLRFDMRTDLTPLLNSYNTKQLFLYLTASYVDEVSGDAHEVVLWDRIITRGDTKKDFRATGDGSRNRSKRPRIHIDDVKGKYTWRNPSRSFENIHNANITLSYHLMPYVGLVTSGVAATAEGMVEIPSVAAK